MPTKYYDPEGGGFRNWIMGRVNWWEKNIGMGIPSGVTGMSLEPRIPTRQPAGLG